jgi:hypothetical protein
VLDGAAPPVHLSPATRDRALAADWFAASRAPGSMVSWQSVSYAPYRAGERTMIKVKYERTADCVVRLPLAKEGAGTLREPKVRISVSKQSVSQRTGAGPGPRDRVGFFSLRPPGTLARTSI